MNAFLRSLSQQGKALLLVGGSAADRATFIMGITSGHRVYQISPERMLHDELANDVSESGAEVIITGGLAQHSPIVLLMAARRVQALRAPIAVLEMSELPAQLRDRSEFYVIRLDV